MSYKLKNIVVFLRVLSDFIILRNFGKNIYIDIYIHIHTYDVRSFYYSNCFLHHLLLILQRLLVCSI